MPITQSPARGEHTEHTEAEERTYTLYKSAGDLELALENALRHDPTAPLTALQRTLFNDALRVARELLPHSRALREDVEAIDDADAAATVGGVYRQVHLVLVPTLHNALPDDYAAL